MENLTTEQIRLLTYWQALSESMRDIMIEIISEQDMRGERQNYYQTLSREGRLKPK